MVSYKSINIYDDDITSLQSVGLDFNSMSELKQALFNRLGIESHSRPKMSEEDKINNIINKKVIEPSQILAMIELLKAKLQ